MALPGLTPFPGAGDPGLVALRKNWPRQSLDINHPSSRSLLCKLSIHSAIIYRFPGLVSDPGDRAVKDRGNPLLRGATSPSRFAERSASPLPCLGPEVFKGVPAQLRFTQFCQVVLRQHPMALAPKALP